MKKKRLILLVLLVMQNYFCYSQNSKNHDTITFYDLKFNGNNLYTDFKNIKKYIDVTKSRARAFTGQNANQFVSIPFEKFKSTDYMHIIYSDFFDFSYRDDNPELIFISRIKIVDKIKICLNNIKLTKDTRIKDLEKNFPNIYENQDLDDYKFKILIIKEDKKAFLSFNFKNDKLSDIMLENFEED